MSEQLDSYLRRTYQMSEEEYNLQLAVQGYVCAICGRTDPSKNGNEPERLSVDHSHRSGTNRSLLCQRCNRVLGMLEDSQELAARIFEYLRKHNGAEMVYPKPPLSGLFDSCPVSESSSQSEQVEDPTV